MDKTTCSMINREAIYDALCLPSYICNYKDAINAHEYGDRNGYSSKAELLDELRHAEEQLNVAQHTIQSSIDDATSDDLDTEDAHQRLIGAIRYLDARYCNYNENAVGLYFAVDILPRSEKLSLWAYLEVTPEGWTVDALRVEPSASPAHEIRKGRIVSPYFGREIRWTGTECFPKVV